MTRIAEWPAEEQLERLYIEPPDQFIAARDRLARALEGEGHVEAAEPIRRLRKPTPAAWLVNQLVLREPEMAAIMLEEAERVAWAERALMRGTGTQARFRRALRQHRLVLVEAMSTIRSIALDCPHRVSKEALGRAEETLLATMLDPRAREAVRRGRLEEEVRVASLRVEGAGGGPDSPEGERPAGPRGWR